MEIKTVEEFSIIQSMIGKLQAQFQRQGYDAKEARKLATEKIGDTYNPPVSVEELNSATGKALVKFYGEKRLVKLREKWNAKKDKSNQTPIPEEEKEESESLVEIYRSWCAQHNHVASDVEIAHFTGRTAPAFMYARKKLIEDGFIFEKNGSGWNITAPVIERVYTEKEVRSMMEELLGKFQKGKR